jgi:hypothetical protein
VLLNILHCAASCQSVLSCCCGAEATSASLQLRTSEASKVLEVLLTVLCSTLGVVHSIDVR